MSEIIICLTGLTGRIRGMKVREEWILSDLRQNRISASAMPGRDA